MIYSEKQVIKLLGIDKLTGIKENPKRTKDGLELFGYLKLEPIYIKRR